MSDKSFTGMKIEQHAALGPASRASGDVCVVYERGRRIACLYFHPLLKRMNFIYEDDYEVEVIRRAGGPREADPDRSGG